MARSLPRPRNSFSAPANPSYGAPRPSGPISPYMPLQQQAQVGPRGLDTLDQSSAFINNMNSMFQQKSIGQNLGAAPGQQQVNAPGNKFGQQGPAPTAQGQAFNQEAQDKKDAKGIWDDLTSQYNDIRKEHADSWAGKQDLAGAQMAAYQRRADSLNAQSGRSVMGGGAAASTRQGMIQGMQHMSAVRNEHDTASRQLQMAWLDKQIGQASRDQDYQRQKALMALQNNNSILNREDEQSNQADLQANELAAAYPDQNDPDVAHADEVEETKDYRTGYDNYLKGNQSIAGNKIPNLTFEQYIAKVKASEKKKYDYKY